MSRFVFILKSFAHYFKANVLLMLGVALSAMVLTGALVIGDSVRYSLTQATVLRLGNTTHMVAANERFFRSQLADEMEKADSAVVATPLLLLEGIATSEGGMRRANRVQVVGVAPDFEKIVPNHSWPRLQKNEVAINQKLADKLGKQEGDRISVRIKKASPVPLNAPFVAADETSVFLNATIKKVLGKEELGRFNLKNSQTEPYNLFLSLEKLNNLMKLENRANRILLVCEEKHPDIQTLLQRCVTPQDAGLRLKHLDHTREVEISTERVFIEEQIARVLLNIPGAKPVFTYFANGIQRVNQGQATCNGRREVPYSFVSACGDIKIPEGSIILNEWTAKDLCARVGDSIALRYYVMGPLRRLEEQCKSFVLKNIIPMDSEIVDASLAPHLPGLTDAGHCSEWEAGIPIDWQLIEKKDETYWDRYKGTPKAFVALSEARELWRNRYGSYTAIRFPKQSFSEKDFAELFRQKILPSDFGLRWEPIREQGLQAARNGTDFSGLFLGLSFFILAASIVLSTMLFRLNIESRTVQIGVLQSMGFRKALVRYLVLGEAALVVVVGVALGLILAVYYTRLVFWGLNTLWSDIVRTKVLEIDLQPETLFMGGIISVFVSLGAVVLTLRKLQQFSAAQLQKKNIQRNKGRYFDHYVRVLAGLLLSFSLVLVVGQLWKGRYSSGLFFVSGVASLLAFLLIVRQWLFNPKKPMRTISFGQLIGANLTRNPVRSLSIVMLFGLASFLVVSTGSNKPDLWSSAGAKTGGTGGFQYFAESTIPILIDLNDPRKRAEEGMSESFRAIQFRRMDGDDASCLNLNRISQPAILGVDPHALAQRFSFATSSKFIEGDPWLALDSVFADGAVPAIADQTVIQWGLGKKIGDALIYQNEKGDTLRLRLVAGIKPSVFQGYVLISEENFLKNFPSQSGSQVFLIETDPSRSEAVAKELSFIFRDYGWEMENTVERLAAFLSVTNTYLSIFLALGTLGLLLGTVGLAVVLARSVLERRSELALMQAVGFKRIKILGMLIAEYFVLLLTGTGMGTMAAVLATLPSFISTNTGMSLSTIALVVVLIAVNGLVWIYTFAAGFTRSNVLISGLRKE